MCGDQPVRLSASAAGCRGAPWSAAVVTIAFGGAATPDEEKCRPSAIYATRPQLRVWPSWAMKCTRYFAAIRKRPDRSSISDAWLLRAIESPIREVVQADGRIRRWCRVPEMANRYLRVILLPDGETVHNAFFDRNFRQ
jgi:hypothetical protein